MKEASADILSTTSRWMARTVAQVKMAPQALTLLFRETFRLNGPNKSTPVIVNGGEKGFTRSRGSLPSRWSGVADETFDISHNS